MNLAEFFKEHGVTKPTWDSFENVENVVGKQVWICDYRITGYVDKKPIRQIPPTFVQVIHENESKKPIYYSPVFFKEVKNGKVLSRTLMPYDGTGYRGYPGVSVNIFYDETECRKFYIQQCKDVISVYEDAANKFKSQAAEIKSEIESNKKLKL